MGIFHGFRDEGGIRAEVWTKNCRKLGYDFDLYEVYLWKRFGGHIDLDGNITKIYEANYTGICNNIAEAQERAKQALRDYHLELYHIMQNYNWVSIYKGWE